MRIVRRVLDELWLAFVWDMEPAQTRSLAWTATVFIALGAVLAAVLIRA